MKNNKKDCAEVVYFKAKINEKKELWSDFEMLLGEITDYYTLAGKEDFLKGLKDMRHAMSDYLQYQSRKFKFKISRYRKELKFSLDNLFCEKAYIHPPTNILSVDRNTQYQFVVFNYNTIVYDIINRIRIKERIRNHNRITDNINSDKKLIHCDTTAGFVLGVNDPSQIKNIQFRTDTDIGNALIKRNQRNIMFESKDIADYINDSNVVYVYGMSIGDTDKHYWEQIIKWVEENDDRKIVLSYYDANITGIDLMEIHRARAMIENKLVRLGLSVANISRVAVVINPKIFQFSKKAKKR